MADRSKAKEPCESNALVLYYKLLGVFLPGITLFKMLLVETDLTMGLDAERRDASGPIMPLYSAALGHE